MSTTKKCRKCKLDIPIEAKICGHCQSKQGSWPQRHYILSAIILLIIISSVLSAFNKNDENDLSAKKNPSDNVKEVKNEKTDLKYQISDVIVLNNIIEAIITSVQTKNQVGGDFFSTTPSEGGIYVVVDWSIKNIDTKPVKSFSTPKIKLISPTGIEYNSDLNATSYYATETKLDRKILSDLNPGILVKDAQVFEINKELWSQTGWKIEISLSGKKALVEIKNN